MFAVRRMKSAFHKLSNHVSEVESARREQFLDVRARMGAFGSVVNPLP